jgi:glycogen debranching enzyme
MGPVRNRNHGAGVEPSMLQPWLQDLESLEAITRSDDARKIFLRMAALSRSGRMPSFLAEIEHDQELDEATKDHVVELARDRSFLVAVEEYLRRTERVH